MKDLLSDPDWQADTLGKPLPDSPHAVSVSLPLWEHVIGYEEGNPAVVGRMLAGYPRFFISLTTQKLFGAAEARFAGAGEGALVFPSRLAAERCRAFACQREPEAEIRLEAMGKFGLWAVVFPESLRPVVRLFWRFSGEIVSSRCAQACLEGSVPDMEEGETARQVIASRLARYYGVGPGDIMLLPSGMAAVSTVHRMLDHVLPNRESVQWDFPYVDVLKVQQELGHGAHFFANASPENLQAIHALAAAHFINGVYVEAPSNPLLRCMPLSEISAHLRASGVPVVIDDTVATVLQVDALKFADLVTTSLTKSFSGVGDVLGGSIVMNPRSPHYEAFRAFAEEEREHNAALWCEDAVVLEANSRDFPKRVRRASQNAEILAGFMATHPAVERVHFATPEDSGLAELLRPGARGGCLLSVILKDPAAAPRVYDALRVCKGPSLGANFTIVCPYTLLAHYTELEWAVDCGVPAHLLRVSVGLEESDDLVQRFADALALA